MLAALRRLGLRRKTTAKSCPRNPAAGRPRRLFPCGNPLTTLPKPSILRRKVARGTSNHGSPLRSHLLRTKLACSAIDDLRAMISQWFHTANFTGKDEVLPGNAPEPPPVIAPKKIPKEAAKAPKKKIKATARKAVVLPPKKPPIFDSPETARPAETEGQSAPPASMRLRTPFPDAPPPGIFSR